MHYRMLLWTGRAAVLTFLAVILLWAAIPAQASAGIQLVIDGEEINSSPPPVIKNGRTLVPVRLVSESLGARVDWNPENRTVDITGEEQSVLLRIDNRLVNYQQENTTFGLSDVSPQIMDSRTFVPLRLVSNALGVFVDWDSDSKTVYIDSSKHTGITSFFNMDIQTVQPGQAITGATELRAGYSGSPPAGAEEIRFLLLDPKTGQGPVIARGNNLTGTYKWLPDPANSGLRVLAAAAYDGEGNFVAGSVIPVQVEVSPRVTLEGLEEQQVVKGTTGLQVDLNFEARYVQYRITHRDTGRVTVTRKADPYGTFDWTPQLRDNGRNTVRAIAYTSTGEKHLSPPVDIKVDVERNLSLRGISPGASVSKPVTLWLARNFPVSQVEYLLKDRQGNREITLQKSEGYASCSWFPGPEQAGTWELLARVKDNKGNTYTTSAISVEIPGNPELYLQSVGPRQVLTGEVKLKALSNVRLDKIKYVVRSPQTGAEQVVASGSEAGKEYTWTPREKDAGNRQIQAVGITASGQRITSEPVPVRVYPGKTYDSRPVIEKSKFLDFASELAMQSQEKTGMSASLQVAQAILETGWGQYTPVDKYTGQPSNNLFGIKGHGPAGSVTSNTWEEYNGNVYHVDAEFRAYYSPEQSWADHKSLLLDAGRYGPYRDVMHDSTRGAWALRRCGYATDSRYPLKLMNIIQENNLQRLDRVDI